MTESSTALGTFNCLPFELRQIVFSECITLNIRRLLRVNTTFYAEYLEALHLQQPFGHLYFVFDPSKHPSTVDILTQYGRRCGQINAASSHLHSDTNSIRTTPIGRYRLLKLYIKAPDRKDPGQAIRLHKQTSAFVTSLSPCWFPSSTSAIPSQKSDCLFPRQMKLPTPPDKSGVSIRIYFMGFEKGHWGPIRKRCDMRRCNHSTDETCAYSHKRLAGEDYKHSDFVSVLRVLEQLRNIHVCVDNLLWPSPDESLLWLINRVDALTSSEGPFGLDWNGAFATTMDWDTLSDYGSGFNYSDRRILRWNHCVQTKWEYLLDDMPGRTANLLRQERFLNWCTAHERQQAKALWGIYSPIVIDSNSAVKPTHRLKSAYGTTKDPWIAGAEQLLDDDSFCKINSSFHSRFWAQTTCNLNDLAGVERKSTNKLWTEFPEKPVVEMDDLDGCLATNEDQWDYVSRLEEVAACKMETSMAVRATECMICKAEEDRNQHVEAQNSVEEKIEALSKPSGLGGNQDLHKLLPAAQRDFKLYRTTHNPHS